MASKPLSPLSPHAGVPTSTLALPATSRRLPPRCWTPDETAALIDAYRDKWYSLHRDNLRANHWQEVAADVASRYVATPPKTAVQCRHKMEKLRMRYRAEIRRAAAARGGPRRFSSSWVHFQSMYSMERGSDPSPSSSSSSSNEDQDHRHHINRINDLYNYSHQRANFNNQNPRDNGGALRFRIKIPDGGAVAPKVYKFDEMEHNPNPNPTFPNSIGGGCAAASNLVLREGFSRKRKTGRPMKKNFKKRPYVAPASDGMGDVAAAIQAFGEGFMRIEKVKMEMVQQMEGKRMEMELKRTETILDLQQRIVEAFAKAICDRTVKRAKRAPVDSSDCYN